ncbi:MAG: undecaprenyldiphospho-muramoylpentapeptide beta-N-acetylglucosaminyltransferase [Gemmatimonadota bacterium]|nr:undecaprenyldiphospho-muramoylpentapeptide beta-N-acetylglucosaminyltransferase [Gemmatimonadota bacterium]MDH5758358.1 undecaprenyldiphospho-muramoylpentapeptide beta-N-acetylglucosaminyltransferase [Gemmatimonadota bacterium]
MHDAPGPVVVFSGGGTGGHLYPALTLADALRARRPAVRAWFVGASRGIEATVLPAEGRPHHLLPVAGFQRGRVRGYGRVVLALLRSLIEVAELFRRLRPEVVVVTGGYAGGPAGIVAGIMGIPLVIQEQNAVPGMTTRLLSRWAREIHVAFPETADRLPGPARARVTLSGNPVRGSGAVTRDEGRGAFGIVEDATVVLVMGGSQGARALNRALLEGLPLERPGEMVLLWSTGPRHMAEVERELAERGNPSWIQAVPYIHDMPSALAAADMAVSRAGAMATAELLNQGLPAILVPLPTAAADHQTRNAVALEEAGAAVVLDERVLTGASLWKELLALTSDPDRRGRMSRSARERARPAAADHIAASIEAILGASRGGHA